jgi:hypothetical protein
VLAHLPRDVRFIARRASPRPPHRPVGSSWERIVTRWCISSVVEKEGEACPATEHGSFASSWSPRSRLSASRCPREESQRRPVDGIDAGPSRTASPESRFSPVASRLLVPAASTRFHCGQRSTADRPAGRSSMRQIARSSARSIGALARSWAPAGRDSHEMCDRTTRRQSAGLHRCDRHPA